MTEADRAYAMVGKTVKRLRLCNWDEELVVEFTDGSVVQVRANRDQELFFYWNVEVSEK